jgi:hypothetical protein
MGGGTGTPQNRPAPTSLRQVLTTPFVLRLYDNERDWAAIGGVATCHFYSFNMLTATLNTIFLTCVIATERCLALRKNQRRTAWGVQGGGRRPQAAGPADSHS